MRAVVLVVALALLGVASAANWAVIVSGSNTYSNYRHTADACHAYQIAKRSGIPADNIITMIYDDIAMNTRNPYPGKIFNKPTADGVEGYDVYEGCKIDYTGSSVTALNFLAIIQGDAAAVKGGNGKVLKSGPNDNIFIFYSDHGSVGIVAFPVGGYLGVRDLNAALKNMYNKRMYNKLVFYLEACNSGSMFENTLPTNINVYATTAAHGQESSWGYYCPPNDSVNGKRIGSCLGDEYSVQWMESVDTAAGLSLAQTWAENFELIKAKTLKSHVMEYGDKGFKSDPMSTIFSSGANFSRTAPVRQAAPVVDRYSEDVGRVNSRDIPLNDKFYEYIRADKDNLADSHAKGRALIAEIEGRMKADTMFLNLAKTVAGDAHSKLFLAEPNTAAFCGDCCDDVHKAVFEFCGGYSDYSFRYAKVVHNICVAEPAAKDLMIHSVRAFCM